MKNATIALGLALFLLAPLSTSAATCPVLSRTLSFGVRGSDVTQLQNFLIAQGHLAAGNNTGHFGSLTQAAVQSFQRSKGIVSSGTPSTTGYGAVGPRTRALIKAACGGKSQSQTTTTSAPAYKACHFGAEAVLHGNYVTAYQSPSVAAGEYCTSETRTCTDGTLSGSYQYAGCLVEARESRACEFGNQVINDGSSALAYQSPKVSDACRSQIRTCTNGVLSGSYQHAFCIVEKPTATANTSTSNTSSSSAPTCSYNGQSFGEGQTMSDSGTTYTCDNGQWIGSPGTTPSTKYCGVASDCNGQAQMLASGRFGLTPRHGKAPLTVTAYAYVKYGFYTCGVHTISWGDGATEAFPRSEECGTNATSVRTHTHTYSSPGNYIVTFEQETISGSVTARVRVE